MGRSTVHYVDNDTNNILKQLHNKLRPAGTPVQRVEYIIELLLLRIFEVKVKHDDEFKELRKLFEGEHYRLLFSYLQTLSGNKILVELNQNFFPFYANILTKVREISSANLNQKVQDYLVLIEEVFANSNFTNNVVGGMMHTIISLVSEIDEERILKTDLLGDAIESSLSETGGTQDVGLYRTPDHVRQMMTAMVDPDFKDRIFDPTCGTGGFLFDAFQYVLEKVTHRGTWPGKKAHHELQEFFAQHLRTSKSAMPTQDEANAFYREGISGVEYLGMIRKMAAINLFIRGLNPANIRQGDSLQMYDPATEKASKTAILANPPFGAERDQDAYPNVWEAYSKESETTILFVKLMFEHLKPGGRCAVVVSEGFLTWDKASARALRKILLEEANLRAVISMPQGVFVSKQGQGAKTSILYFEKGGPTDWVWYYKVENDGYSMGTNRQQIDDSQLPGLLTLFTRYVKQGRIPPETDHSFAIPVQWITTLDPRSKAAIRQETREKRRKRDERTRRKKIEQLEQQRAKGKIDDAKYQKQLRQFDEHLEIQIQNEIAKNIEKAHLYSLNLGSYRSNLNAQQLEEWRQALVGRVEPSQQSLDERYQVLQQANPETALNILASFDPRNALEIDIARHYLHTIDEDALQGHEKLLQLFEVLKGSAQYPLVLLRDLIVVNTEKMKPKDFPDTEFVMLGVSNQTGVFINERKQGDEINQAYYRVAKNQFCYNPYRVNVGSIGFNEFDYENQIISGAYNIFRVKENEIHPKFLLALIKTQRFLDYVNELASGGVRMDFKIEHMQNWLIPLPSLDIQRELVEKIEKQEAIIQGANQILVNWVVHENLFREGIRVELGKIVTIQRGKFAHRPRNDPKFYGGEYPFIQINDVTADLKYISKYSQTLNEEGIKISKKFEKGTLVMSIASSIGEVGILNFDAYFPDSLVAIFPKDSQVLTDYLFWYFKCFQDHVIKLSSIAVQKNINVGKLEQFRILLPSLSTQALIVEQLDKEMAALEQVRLLKTQAERRIEQLLNVIWGEA